MHMRWSIDAVSGAGNETRTRDPNLGKVVLYQLSYSRWTEPDFPEGGDPLSSDSDSREPSPAHVESPPLVPFAIIVGHATRR